MMSALPSTYKQAIGASYLYAIVYTYNVSEVRTCMGND